MASLADYALIANSVKDDVLTPQENGIQRQQLKSLALGNQAQEMKLGQAQKAIGYEDTLKQAIQKNTAVDPATQAVKVNHAQVAADLANAGHADQAYEYMNQQHAATYEKQKGAIAQIAQLAQGVLSQPEEVRPQAYAAALQQARDMGMDVSKVPPQYDPNYLTGIINMAVDAKTHFEADNRLKTASAGGGGENVFLSTPGGYIAANKRTAGTQVLKDAAGNPYIPSNIDIPAQTNLTRSKEKAKADVELATKPAITSAVTTAKEKSENEAKNAQSAKKNENALAVFENGMKSLESGLSNTSTNPIAGKIPAITSEAQTAEGAIAAMAPVLKGLFREAGEGTFTEGDQKILMEMLPTRSDHPEARKTKIDNINKMVKIKLSQFKQGGSGQGSSTPGIISNTPTVSNW